MLEFSLLNKKVGKKKENELCQKLCIAKKSFFFLLLFVVIYSIPLSPCYIYMHAYIAHSSVFVYFTSHMCVIFFSFELYVASSKLWAFILTAVLHMFSFKMYKILII